MKKIWTAMTLLWLVACNSANDGSPKTDTTTMPTDTNLNRDTVNHVNRADGTIRTDTVPGTDTMRNNSVNGNQSLRNKKDSGKKK